MQSSARAGGRGRLVGCERRRKRDIAVAVAQHGRLEEIEVGRNRNEVATWLIERQRQLEEDFGVAEMVVGFDFAFSFPRWFLHDAGLPPPPTLWSEINEERAECWLSGQAPWPFWGRGDAQKKTELAGDRAFRATELEAAAGQGIGPKVGLPVGG
jgi:hypothetical protein